MPVRGGPDIITDGLILCLDAANPKSYPGGGNAWHDLINPVNDASIAGGTFNPDGYFELNGTTSDGMELAGTNLSLNTMTISSWNYSVDYAHNGFLFEKTTDGTVNTQYSFFVTASEYLIFRTYGLSTISYQIALSTIEVVNGAWNNLVCTFDGTKKRLYCNGSLKSLSTPFTGTITANDTGAAYIGVYGSFVGYPFNGNIASNIVYNRALSDLEVLQNYNSIKSRYDIL